MTLSTAYYQNPSHVTAASIALPITAVIFLIARFWSRSRNGQPLWVDDWLMVPATALTIAMGAMTAYGVSVEAIAHRVDLPPGFEGDPLALNTDQLAMTSRIGFSFTLMIPIALGTMKLSFIYFYYRIFVVNKRATIRRLLQSFIGLLIVWTLAFFFSTLFECGTNFWAIWGSTADLADHCIRTVRMILVFCVSDFITDLMIMIIPVPLIWRLQLSSPKKFATTGVFLLGGVSVAASLCRLTFTIQAATRDPNDDVDEILTTTGYLYWGIIECGIGVIAACLPTAAALVKSFKFGSRFTQVKSILSSTTSGSSISKTTSAHELKPSPSPSSDSGASSPPNPSIHDFAKTSNEYILGDMESAFSEVSRGSNRLNGDPENVDSYTTDSSWRTRFPSVPECNLAPPPVSHHMKDLRALRGD